MNTIFLFLGLMLVGTFLGAYSDVQKKKYLNRGIDEQVLLSVSLILGALTLVPILFLFGLPKVQPGFWMYAGTSILLGVIASNLFIRAVKLSELSLIAPLRFLTPLLVIITGYVFLGEQLSLVSAVGILITVASLWWLLFPDNLFSLTAIKSMRQEKGVLLGLLAATLYAIGLPFDKQAVLASSGLFSSVCIIGSVGLITLLINAARRWRAFKSTLFYSLKNDALGMLLISASLGLGGFMTRQALAYSFAAYVSNLNRLQALWTVVLSGKFLQEKDTAKRLWATFFMLVGIVISVVWQ